MPQFEAEVVESISPAERFGRNVQISPDSAYGRELAKHEQFPVPWAPRPGNPYKFREYPRMVYRATEHPRSGQRVVLMPIPQRHEFATDDQYRLGLFEAETINRKVTKIVNDDTEFQKAMEAGWRPSPVDALEFAKARHDSQGEAAAERNWQDRNMGEKAKAEAATAEAAAPLVHLAEIPRTPVKPRGFAAMTPAMRAAAVAKAKETRAAHKAEREASQKG